MIRRKIFLFTGVVACFLACIGDFVVTLVAGSFYPGYSQLRDTMSSLGASVSPVSEIISWWWVVLGMLIILFALSFFMAFSPGKYVRAATWLLILYGLGEGLGSGLFKADLSGSMLTRSAWIHDALGGIGVAALVVLPLFMQQIIPRSPHRGFYFFSTFVLISGILLLLLFLARYTEIKILADYKGLWQRLFVFDYYVYLLSIAIFMIRNSGKDIKEG